MLQCNLNKSKSNQIKFRMDFQLREIFCCRKFSLSFFSIVGLHAELSYSEARNSKKACGIFWQRNILRNWKSRPRVQWHGRRQIYSLLVTSYTVIFEHLAKPHNSFKNVTIWHWKLPCHFVRSEADLSYLFQARHQKSLQ